MTTAKNFHSLVNILRNDLPTWATRYARIRPKVGGLLVPFTFNRAQLATHAFLEEIRSAGGPVRAAIVKGRQMGISTYIMARFLHRATLNRGVSVFILAHITNSTGYLFDMVKRTYNNLPEELRPSAERSNKIELKFGAIDSDYALGTAGSEEIGRGRTPLLLHCCLAEGTLVQESFGGMTRIEDLEEGTFVRTHKNNSGRVSLITEQYKPCFSVKIGSTTFPLEATKEHKFFTPKGFVELKDLSVGDEVGFPIKRITGEATLVQFKKPFKGNKRGGGVRENVPERVLLNYDMGRILGLYLAEGSITRESVSGKKRPCGVSFAVHRREVSRTVECVKKVSKYFSSFSVYHRKDSLTSSITIYGASFGGFVNRMCGRKKDKHFPFSWSEAGEDFVRGLAEGYISGDGYFDPKLRVLTTTSIVPALSSGIRDILVSLGYGWGALGFNPGGVRNGRIEQDQYPVRLSGVGANVLAMKVFGKGKPYLRKNNAGYYRYRITDGFVWQRIKKIEPVGERKVYDIEVDHEDHSYCVAQVATHNSEAAKYRNTDELQTGLIQGVPMCAGSEIIYESTANGVNNMFYKLCMQGLETEGQDRIKTLFLPWFWQDEYRAIPPVGFSPTPEENELIDKYDLDMGQVYWRRRKLEDDFNGDVWKLMQEFPCNLMEAFITSGDTLIKGEYVQDACKNVIEPDPVAPKILGVDGADSGDRTALVLRQGKKVLGFWVHNKMRPMDLAGIVAKLIDKEDIDMVFFDVAYGDGAHNRLEELGYGSKVQKVHFGSAALDPEIYRNKRAQMYGYMKEWFEEGGTDIPNDGLFCRDMLMTPGFERTGSKGLLSLPSKITIRKDNGGVSPDIADALALTFAFPVMRRNAVARVSIASDNSAVASVFKTKRRIVGIGKTEGPSELFVR